MDVVHPHNLNLRVKHEVAPPMDCVRVGESETEATTNTEWAGLVVVHERPNVVVPRTSCNHCYYLIWVLICKSLPTSSYAGGTLMVPVERVPSPYHLQGKSYDAGMVCGCPPWIFIHLINQFENMKTGMAFYHLSFFSQVKSSLVILE